MDYIINGYRIRKNRVVEPNDSGYRVEGFDHLWDGLGEAMAWANSRPEPGPVQS